MSEETIFHKIMNKEIPAVIVFEDDLCVAFKDVNPVAPTHVLIVPRATIGSLNQAVPDHEKLLGHLLMVARDIAASQNFGDGYRVVINTGADAGQTVFQLHVHLIGGRKFHWPPG
ncbi:MAG: histidine triad nucleotide-binding protein [Deltaproteobacteria bacterium]|nr:histidine triad nucleotide-binding protein [Deltaproteobacteria bacterium]